MSICNSICIGCDHAGVFCKEKILQYIRRHMKNIGIIDYGTHSNKDKTSASSVDYPAYAHLVAQHVIANPNKIGILICGSANGMAMSANKFKNVRAAVCWNAHIASLARQHNDANILCIPARFVTVEDAISIVQKFLRTKSSDEPRHVRRISNINPVFPQFSRDI
jgi:ribose 5-phosphate isomerase B